MYSIYHSVLLSLASLRSAGLRKNSFIFIIITQRPFCKLKVFWMQTFTTITTFRSVRLTLFHRQHSKNVWHYWKFLVEDIVVAKYFGFIFQRICLFLCIWCDQNSLIIAWCSGFIQHTISLLLKKYFEIRIENSHVPSKTYKICLKEK